MFGRASGNGRWRGGRWRRRSLRGGGRRLRRSGRGALRRFGGAASVLWINLRKQFCDFLRWPWIRQWHLAAAGDRIEALWHQDDEARIIPQPARHPSGVGAGPEINIGARRADDGRSGVLRHHQPPKRCLGLLRLDRQIAFDKKQRAVDMQRLVDRDRAARRQRNALRTHCLILVGELHLAKEYVGPVLPPQFVGAVGILIHPFSDPLHRHLFFRDDAAINQDATDRRIGITIMRVVIDADGRAVVEADPRRTLDLREQQIGLILQPADLEAAAGNRTVFDLGTIIVGHELAAADFAKHLALVGQAAVALLLAAHEQVRGTAIDRNGIDVGLRPRPVDDRLVVAGNEALALPEPRDP